MSKLSLKIYRESSQNRPWEGPGGVPGVAREPLWSLLGACRAGFLDAAKISEEFEAFWVRPEGHSGTQPGPKNQEKIYFLPKR